MGHAKGSKHLICGNFLHRPLARSPALAIGSCPSPELCLSPFAKLLKALVGNCRLPQPVGGIVSEIDRLTKRA